MDFSWIEAIPVPAVVVARDDNLLAANRQFARLFPGFEPGRNYVTVLRQPKIRELVDQARTGTALQTADILGKGASVATFRATGSMVGDQDVLICLQDVNETANAVQMRRQFVSDLSHELRSPLTAIAGILETGADDPEALRHFLPTLSSEVARMSQLVNDLLTLSRVEQNQRRNPRSVVDLAQVVSQACAPLKAFANGQKVRLELGFPEEEVRVLGDANDLETAVRNLVENAVRYGGAGGLVEVRITKDSGAGSPGGVVIVVQDHGGGVDPHHLPRLTERFYRVQDHRSRHSGGSGLGLAIVKHVVARHRGRLELANVPNKGLRVSIHLPKGAPVAGGSVASTE